ncbi:MAG: hypothetical protein Q8J62_09965 [Candidatus Cloacimonadaceae bacterium]|nr:hypothetical protein [Candidatus Cloacimonadaceae bacterium]
MKLRKTAILIMPLLILGMMIVSCAKKTTEPNDLSAANVYAREGMAMLNQVILDMEDSENQEFNSPEDVLLQATFNQIEAKFLRALELDADNPMGNLGMSILEIIRINYDAELWAMIEDGGNLKKGSKRIINNQFQFLADAPLIALKQMNPDKSSAMSIMRLQNYIKTAIIPRLNNSIRYLGDAVALADSNMIMIDTGEELVEVDCGEIFAFRATVHAVNAAFNLMVAYNWDMVDTGNGYDWISQIANIDVPAVPGDEAYAYHVESTMQGNTLYIDYWDGDYSFNAENALGAEIQAKILKHNLDNNASFGVIANQTYLNGARNGIINAARDIRLCTGYILSETDTQNNDVIKIEHIISLNEDIADDDEGPNFAQDWDSVDDIATWLETIVSGPYDMFENNTQFTINLGAFFNGSITDVRDVIPYFHWNNPSVSWVENYISNEHNWNVGGSHYFNYQGVWTTITGVVYVVNRYHRLEVNPGYPTDPQGNAIDSNDVPYFPDYTFKGVLPGMNRAKFIQLFG